MAVQGKDVECRTLSTVFHLIGPVTGLPSFQTGKNKSDILSVHGLLVSWLLIGVLELSHSVSQ